MTKTKDRRKTLRNVKVEANGNCAFISGKLDPETKTLKIYQYDGDIRIREEAIQNYAIEHHIDTVHIKV